jgi:hypothetical protein
MVKNILKVEDQYRTNPLSLKPGGCTLTITYSDGKVFIYDKVKNAVSYIRALDKNHEHGTITEILIDGKKVTFDFLKT